MKHVSRLLPLLAGAVAVAGASGMIAVGCGSSSSSTPPSDAGGVDATTDVLQGEAAVSPDTGSDVNAAPDAGSTPDADAGPDGDAGNTPDADADIGDSSVAVTAQTYPGQVATAWCNTIAACCGTSGDAATFDWQTCYTRFLSFGFQGSGTGANLIDGGNVGFNAAQARTCLSTITAADCVSNQLTSTEQIQLYQACYAAYTGTLTAGSACAGTIECTPGDFCLPVDGGVGDAGGIGFCQALAGDGGGCGVLGANQTVGQSVCSYRGSASNGLFCQNISGDAGTTQLDSAAWTCQPQWPLGSDCYANQDCMSMICHEVGTTSAFQCASAGNWANPSTCSTYVIAVDAGAD